MIVKLFLYSSNNNARTNGGELFSYDEFRYSLDFWDLVKQQNTHAHKIKDLGDIKTLLAYIHVHPGGDYVTVFELNEFTNSGNPSNFVDCQLIVGSGFLDESAYVFQDLTTLKNGSYVVQYNERYPKRNDVHYRKLQLVNGVAEIVREDIKTGYPTPTFLLSNAEYLNSNSKNIGLIELQRTELHKALYMLDVLNGKYHLYKIDSLTTGARQHKITSHENHVIISNDDLLEINQLEIAQQPAQAKATTLTQSSSNLFSNPIDQALLNEKDTLESEKTCSPG